MAQLAAQDYFSRLQASGLSQLPFSHSDLAAAAAAGFPSSLGGMGGGVNPVNGTSSGRGGGAEPKNSRNRKDKKNNANTMNNSNAYKVSIGWSRKNCPFL